MQNQLPQLPVLEKKEVVKQGKKEAANDSTGYYIQNLL
jgi:hypothetical protein